MCVQCIAGATTVVAGASGIRVWLRAWSPDWLTPVVMKRVTVALVVGVLFVSSVLLTGGPPEGAAAAQ
ncbi:MAG: hypothetical protein ACPGWS_00375 [Solirubrobacterales bacterium]